MDIWKRITSSFTLAMMVVCAMTLTACGDDDDDNSEGGSSTSVDNPLVNEGGVLLTSISDQYNSWSPDTYYMYYDEKLRPYRYCWGAGNDEEEYLVIDYDNGKISMPDWSGATNLSMSLNSKGYITKIKGSWNTTDDGEQMTGSMEWSASYDKEGHLTEMTINQEEKYGEDVYKSNSKTTLSWNDGKWISYKSESTWIEEGYTGFSTMTSTFTYGTQPNKYKQYPGMFSANDEGGLFAMGLFGIGPNMLPTASNEVETEESDGEKYEHKHNGTVTFTLNSNGSIDTETWSSETGSTEKFTFGYTDAKSIAKATTRSNRTQPSLSKTEKAKRIREFMHNLPFVPHRRGER